MFLPLGADQVDLRTPMSGPTRCFTDRSQDMVYRSLDTIEREIDQEARARFPGSTVLPDVPLPYGDDPGIEPRGPVGPGAARRRQAAGLPALQAPSRAYSL